MYKIMSQKKFNILISLIVFMLVFTLAEVTALSAYGDENYENEEYEARESFLREDITYENHYTSGIDMDVFWNFSEEETGEEKILIRLETPETGWVSIGFEPSRRMQDAEIIIVGFEEEVTLEEHYGNAPTSHEQIEASYIEEYYAERDQEGTVAEFIVPLTEESRYELEPGESYEVILGYHDSSDNFLDRHTQRTSTEIEF